MSSTHHPVKILGVIDEQVADAVGYRVSVFDEAQMELGITVAEDDETDWLAVCELHFESEELAAEHDGSFDICDWDRGSYPAKADQKWFVI